MKTSAWCVVLLAASLLGSGCKTYVYRVVRPQASPVITEQPMRLHEEPLDYTLHRYRDRLVMQIMNPTTNRIILEGNRSYVVDPHGESHPLRGRVLGPHSFTALLLPPRPITAEVVGGYWPGWGYGWGWGGPWGWGWGWGPGVYGGFYGDWFYGPPVTYYQVYTPYDWRWKEGPVRLRLSYEQQGKTFEQDWELVREPAK